MNRPIRLLVGLCALAVFAPAFAQAVYTWKDDKGVTHYSDSPPPAGAKKKDVRTQPDPVAAPAAEVKPASAADAAAKPKPDPAAEQAAQAAEEKHQKARAQACKEAQANLAVLNSQAAVSMDNDGDGKADQVLDDKARKQQVQTMQTVASANCN